MPRPLRSFLAVIAGFAVMFVIVIVCTILCLGLMHLKSGHPTPGYLVINVVYSLSAAAVGGWVTGRVSGFRPIAHGVALALLMLVQSTLFLLHPAASQPFLYQVFLTVIPPLAAIAGSALVRSR
jgi:hypothetical protein